MRFGPASGGRRPARLRTRPQFLAVGEAGRRAGGPALSVQVLDRAADDEALRVGLTITKRVGHATERNRIRRRLRAAVLLLGGRLDRSADIVVVGRRDALSLPFARLADDLARAIDRASRPKPDPGGPAPSRPGRRPTSQPSP